MQWSQNILSRHMQPYYDMINLKYLVDQASFNIQLTTQRNTGRFMIPPTFNKRHIFYLVIVLAKIHCNISTYILIWNRSFRALSKLLLLHRNYVKLFDVAAYLQYIPHSQINANSVFVFAKSWVITIPLPGILPKPSLSSSEPGYQAIVTITILGAKTFYTLIKVGFFKEKYDYIKIF